MLDSLLVEGDHFGEIALMYKCLRTASVICRNYNTLARLNYEKWREVVNEYPKYLQLLKMYVSLYEDPFKEFIRKLIMRINYLSKYLTSEDMNTMIYTIKHK